MLLDFNLTCRLCLIQDAQLTPIFKDVDKTELPLSFASKILACVSIEVKIGDNMPNQICNKCIQQLDDWIKFKEVCDNSNLILQQNVTTSQTAVANTVTDEVTIEGIATNQKLLEHDKEKTKIHEINCKHGRCISNFSSIDIVEDIVEQDDGSFILKLPFTGLLRRMSERHKNTNVESIATNKELLEHDKEKINIQALNSKGKGYTSITSSTEIVDEIDDEEVVDQKIVDEEVVAKEIVDKEIVDKEEVVDKKIVDEEIVDQKIDDEEVVDQKIVDEEVIDQKIVDEEVIDQQIVDQKILEEVVYEEIVDEGIIDLEIVDEEIGDEIVEQDNGGITLKPPSRGLQLTLGTQFVRRKEVNVEGIATNHKLFRHNLGKIRIHELKSNNSLSTDIVEEIVDAETVDEEIVDAEIVDEEIVAEEIVAEEIVDEEIIVEEIVDEEIVDQIEEGFTHNPSFAGLGALPVGRKVTVEGIANDQDKEKTMLYEIVNSNEGDASDSTLKEVSVEESNRDNYKNNAKISRRRKRKRPNMKIEEIQFLLSKKKYHCEFCSELFSTFNDLLAHDETDHSDISKNVPCKACSKTFINTTRLTIHELTGHKEKKPHVCKICGEKFLFLSSLKTHKFKHSQSVCSVCGQWFKSEMSLISHMRNHMSGIKFDCDYCDRSFLSRGGLATHKRTHPDLLQEDYFKCKVCGFSSTNPSSIYLHKVAHKTQKPFVCEVCEKTFATPSHLSDHRKIHNRDKRYACNKCSMCFYTKRRINIHMRVHIGERPFECEVCGKSFAMKASLKQHIRIHTGEMTYMCEKCLKNFNFLKNLKMHRPKCDGPGITVD